MYEERKPTKGITGNGGTNKTPPTASSKNVTVETPRASVSLEDLLSERPSIARRSTGKKYSFNKRGIRLRLNQSDSTEKPTLITEVDSPFAVKNRLMNLMGTNKVKLMKRSYNKTLYRRLSSYEENKIQKRIENREMKENNRLRELVIGGELEPDKEMLSHPVVRVNQTIQRLDAINKRFFELGTAYAKVPPITPVEPLINDPSGKIFKSYPSHIAYRKAGFGFKVTTTNEKTSETILEEDDEEEMEILYTIDDNLIENKKIEPEITDSNEAPSEVDSAESVQSSMANEENTSSIAKPLPSKQILTNSIATLLDSNIYLTKSLQNLVHEFNNAITLDEKSRKEFSVLVHSANYKDSFVQQLESAEPDQPEIFQLGNKITKLYERKQKAAEDKIKKVAVGDIYGRGSM